MHALLWLMLKTEKGEPKLPLWLVFTLLIVHKLRGVASSSLTYWRVAYSTGKENPRCVEKKIQYNVPCKSKQVPYLDSMLSLTRLGISKMKKKVAFAWRNMGLSVKNPLLSKKKKKRKLEKLDWRHFKNAKTSCLADKFSWWNENIQLILILIIEQHASIHLLLEKI